MNKNNLIILAIICIFGYLFLHPTEPSAPSNTDNPEVLKKPLATGIKDECLPHKSYKDTLIQLRSWDTIAPNLVEVGVYGKSTIGSDLCYIRLTNELSKDLKYAVLITSCIHGNEPLAAGVVMSYINTILAKYNTNNNDDITTLLDKYEIYFVPVVSPDSYPNSRYVDGVDPNRDFATPDRPTHTPTASIKAISKFFIQKKFCAAISGHTFGRQFLTPWGYKNDLCDDDKVFNDVFGQMAKLSGYQHLRACQLYGRPISGSEVDFYYSNGAMSCVMEMGTHQHIPTLNDIQTEYNMTWNSIIYFLEHANALKTKNLLLGVNLCNLNQYFVQ